MKYFIQLLAVFVLGLAGCSFDLLGGKSMNPAQREQRVSEEFDTVEVRPIPMTSSEYIVRTKNGDVWYVAVPRSSEIPVEKTILFKGRSPWTL